MSPTIKGFSTKDPKKLKELMQYIPIKPIDSPEGQELLAKMEAKAPKPIKKPAPKKAKKTPPPVDDRCTATTKAGTRCKHNKVGRSKFCGLHRK